MLPFLQCKYFEPVESYPLTLSKGRDLYKAWRNQDTIDPEALEFESDVAFLLIPAGAHHLGLLGLILWSDHFARYRPKFKRGARQWGLLEYWQERGFPPQCRPVGEDDFECE